MQFVKPQNSLKKKLEKNNIIADIEKKIMEIKDYKNYKDDLEFLLYICLLIENSLDKKKKGEKIDKKQIVIDLFIRIFGENNINKENISNNIQFLHDNEKIAKISTCTLLMLSTYEWFSKKFF